MKLWVFDGVVAPTAPTTQQNFCGWSVCQKWSFFHWLRHFYQYLDQWMLSLNEILPMDMSYIQ